MKLRRLPIALAHGLDMSLPARRPIGAPNAEGSPDVARALKQRPTRRTFQTAREALDELAQLRHDWDSYGASPPTAAAISAAQGLLASVAEQYAETTDEWVLPWATAPLADGGVQFEWRGPGGAIEVEITPQGRFGYLVERDERTVKRSDPGDNTLVGEVVRELRGVFYQ